MHHTDPFGQVPSNRIATATLESASQAKQKVVERSECAMREQEWHQLGDNEEFLRILDDFRAEVGALWLRLWKKLDEDIEKAHVVSGSFWRCVWESLIKRQLRPQKYRAICGTRSQGYGALVAYLANVPAQDRLVERWQRKNWKEYVDRIWRTKNQLIEKEREYRDVAVANTQIGIGVGGMLLGLLGLVLSVIAGLIL